ncbi:DUF2589 domain-containing protein [Aestuariibacter halophilus]|uniref:DUF2589 domain-containing protein n=1 Tax=Fluctibacter halophilus TaxID=226011 RepID=A0ABS8G6S7_9ALTE|nr:DUF2589 domain-containing protein [Aestuariibacter halophilus]MCC2616113.1 DUF2589 domain-containing protein [Aestuariibacter halophilus]
MADTPSSSHLAKQFSGVPLKALMGAPLKAASDANGMLARSQTQFLLSTCFDVDENKPGYMIPRMISFTLSRQVLASDGSHKTTESMDFVVPLMAIIPINSLAIETLKVSFEMDVKSTTEYSQESSQSHKDASDDDISRPYRGHQYSTEVHGSLRTSGKGKTSSAVRYVIELTAGQLPLPKGITTILDVFSKNLTPIPSKTEDSQ